jgi:transglutaminase-like putative cysteine protease
MKIKIQHKIWLDPISIILVFFILRISARRLEVTEWMPNLNIPKVLVFYAFVLGLLLGLSNFNKRKAAWFGFAYTCFFIPWQLGGIIESDVLWGERLISLVGRLWSAFTNVLLNKPLHDPVLFLFAMSLLYWLLSIYAGYQLIRNSQPWVSIIAAGIALVIYDVYPPAPNYRVFYTSGYVFFTLLLLGRIFYLKSRDQWRTDEISVESDTEFNLSRSTILAGISLVVIAWTIPAFINSGVAAFSGPWAKIQDRYSNLFLGLESPSATVGSAFGDDLELGLGDTLGDELIFTVKATSTRSKDYRYYWHGYSYDYYENGNWTNTFVENSIRSAYYNLHEIEYKGRTEVELNYTIEDGRIYNVYTPNYPTLISRTSVVIGPLIEDVGQEFVAILAEPPLYSGESMKIEALVNASTVAELSRAGEAYPEWITDKYLQLPEDFSPDLADLAERVTADYETPFDKTMVLTQYLRDNIEYVETVPAPPEDIDPIEWFIFDLQQGFCNYYASAEVLMLRSLGIPARLSVGYSQGERNTNGEYEIRLVDAHAWPEVYFPEYGWIEFEPTVSEPELFYPIGDLEEDEEVFNPLLSGGTSNVPMERDLDRNMMEDLELPGDGTPYLPTATQKPTWWISWVILGLGLLILGVFIWMRNRSDTIQITIPSLISKGLNKRGIRVPSWLDMWAQRMELSPFERMFLQIDWMLKLSGAKVKPRNTPAEKANLLIFTVPETKIDTKIFIEEYQKSKYSPHPYTLGTARIAYLKMWQASIKRFMNRIFG